MKHTEDKIELEQIKLHAYCPECDEYLKDYQVTSQDYCDLCGTLVDYLGEIEKL
jgi:Zn finger protein HypA/HybF involved in hydrogenase expression